MAGGRWVSYLRVSTDRQGRSGLGLEAQRKAVDDFLNGGDSNVVKEFVEVESGKRSDRPSWLRLIWEARSSAGSVMPVNGHRLLRPQGPTARKGTYPRESGRVKRTHLLC
jgi:DNA invertase Pin-like site-specific DNA recombinase